MTEVEPNFKEPSAKKRRKTLGRSLTVWRKRVLARDSYRCRSCGHRDLSGRSLSAHHLIFLSHCAREYEQDSRNGATLCNWLANSCHELLHDRKLVIDPGKLPKEVIECLAEQGLSWNDDGEPVGTLYRYFGRMTNVRHRDPDR